MLEFQTKNLEFEHVQERTASRLENSVHEAYSKTSEFFRDHEKQALVTAGAVVIGTAAIFAHVPTVAKLVEISSKSSGGASFLKSVDNFFFDFDRTLINTDKAYQAHHDSLVDQLGVHTGLSKEFLDDAVTQTQQKLGSHFFADRLDLVEPLQEKFPGVNLNEKFPEIALKSHEAYYAALKPPDDVVKMLEHLQASGKSIFLFTAGSPAHTMDKLQGSGLTHFFDRVFTGAKHPFEDSPSSGIMSANVHREEWSKIEELAPKPKYSTAGYNEIVQRIGVEPSRSMMSGDTLAHDVVNAQAAGFYAAKVNWFKNDIVTDGVVPDLVLEHPQELTRLLQQ